MPSTTLVAASALFLAMAVAGQTAASNTSSTAPARSTITTSASLSATYIPVFEAGPTTLGMNGFAGSIVAADSSATTVQVVCTDTASCEGDNTITLIEGPSTWDVGYATKYNSAGVAVSLSISEVCNIVSSTQAATCTVTGVVSAEYSGVSSSTTTSATETWSSTQIYYDKLLITAGADKLNKPSATSTSTGATSTSTGAAAPIPTANIGMSVGGVAAAAAVAVAGLL